MNLNSLQKYAFNQICLGKNVFITGAGGVGKSYLLEYIVKWFKENKYAGEPDAIAVTSTTGASALLIGGKTIHSFSGIGLGKNTKEETMEKLKKKMFIKNRWQKTRILIIDEISMMSPNTLELIEYVARKCRYRDNKPFGGVQIILSGDFAQLPPINIKEFCFESTIWNTIIDETIYLTKIVRQTDEQFCNALNEIRLGTCSDATIQLFNSRLNIKLTNDYGILPTKLYGYNYKVNEINDKYLQKLVAEGKQTETYIMHVKINQLIDNSKIKPIIDRMVKECSAEENIVLAQGAQVMLIANYNMTSGLANGSRGIIERFDAGGLPVVRFLNGALITIEKWTWEFELDVNKISVNIIQIPLKLAYAMTIHRGQGSSLDYVKTSIDESIFEYGQAYVVLSRVRNLNGLSLKEFDTKRIKAHERVVQYYNQLEQQNKHKKFNENDNAVEPKKLISDYFSDISTSITK